MRKIYLFMMVSLDGYFEGPNHDLSWHNVDDEFNRFAIEQLNEADLFLFGRRMYQLMEGFWPKAAEDPNMSKENIEIARLMNNTKKIVFSRSLDKVEEGRNWKNVRLVREFNVEEIRRLKKQEGRGIWVGGSDLALSFIESGLIDEFRLMVNPVFIGEGTPLFKGLDSKLDLELIKARTFSSGNVLLYYKPRKQY
jgi:dihydrofolate reductase